MGGCLSLGPLIIVSALPASRCQLNRLFPVRQWGYFLHFSFNVRLVRAHACDGISAPSSCFGACVVALLAFSLDDHAGACARVLSIGVSRKACPTWRQHKGQSGAFLASPAAEW